MDTFLKENLITTKNAAELSGYTSDYLARLARSGKIVGKKIGHSWLIDTESLARFSEEQGDRKVDYARELARTRETEYLLHQDSRRGVAHHSSPNQGTNIPTPARYISQLDVAKSPLRSNVFAFSVTALVLISAALVARAGVIQRLAEGTGSLAFGIASGFNGVSGDISSYAASRAGAMIDEIRAQSADATTRRSLLPARIVSPLEEFNLSVVSQSNPSPARPLSFFENTPPRSFATLAFIPTAPAPTPARGLKTLRASASATYAFLTTPSLIARTLEDTFIAFGAAIIDTAHFAIRADVAFAYNFGNAAPEGARAVTAFLGTTGDLLARATARVPTLATALYLRVTDAPATLAPRIASAVFDAEYRVAARYVALANTTAARYVALISGTGNLAYEGTAGTLTLARAAASLLSRAPAALEDAYLGALGKGALALRSLEGELKDEIELAAVLPTLSAGERVALFTYQTVRGLFDSATRALAALFGTSSNVAIVSSPSPTVLPFATSTTSVNAPPPTAPPPAPVLPTSAPAPRIAAVTNNYPTYTTVVKGVSEDFVNQSLVSLRTGILATVAGMVQPVAAQTVTNATTIQQVNMIQDLSNLIVRNGDFRGGVFDNGERVSAKTGTFTNLSGGATSGTSGTFSGGLTAATLGVGTTSPSDTLAVAGPLYLSQISAPGVTTNRLYNVAGALTWNGTALGAGGGTSSWATTTSTVAGQLINYPTNATTDIVVIGSSATTSAPFFFDPNITTGYISGKLGIGTTSPYAKLSVVGETVSSYFTATSTTATTTLAGGLNVGSGKFSVLQNGNVGVGTTNPRHLLQIGNGDGTPNLSEVQTLFTNTGLNGISVRNSSNNVEVFLLAANPDAEFGTLTNSNLRISTNNTTRMVIDTSGNVGIGTTSPYAKLSVVGETVSSYFTATSTTATSTFMGAVGIGTTSPWRTLSVTGTVAFSGITSATGAGSLCLTSANDVTYNSGSDACLSSLRSTKHDIHNLTVSGLDTLDALQPVSFVYNTDIVPDGRTRYGFVAEDTAVVDRHLTSYDAKGALSGIDDRAILSVAVRAIQELNAKFSVPRDATTTMPSFVLTADGKGIDLYKLATFTLSGMEALAAKVDAQNIRLTSLEERVAALESGEVRSTGGSLVSFSTSSLASALDSFGVLIQKGIAQFNTLVFRQLVASSDEDGTSSAGSVTILAGNTVAQVNNSLVKPSTKAFVTFNSPITGSWWVSDKAAGSFRVVLSAPQDADVSFDYFLVQTEGQIAASTTDGSFGGETATVAVAVSPPSSTDTVPPVITLLGDNPMYLSIGGEFIEPGITVTDNVDSVVPYSTFVDGIQMETSSAMIDTSIQTTHIITYSAIDSRGNSATATRAVIVGSEASAPADSGSNDSLQAGSLTSSAPVVSDVEPPVVTLVGAAALQIDEGQTFTDPGATATDDIDGDLTASIVVTGAVDATTSGLYTLTYSATDAAGNSGSASRVVTVVATSAPQQ